MTDDKRISKLEKTVKGFNLTVTGSGASDILGGFPEYKQKNTLEERLQHLEKLHEGFTIRGGQNAKIEGSIKTGFVINVQCP